MDGGVGERDLPNDSTSGSLLRGFLSSKPIPRLKVSCEKWAVTAVCDRRPLFWGVTGNSGTVSFS